MDNAQKAIMIGVGLFITIIIISAVLLIVNLGTDLVEDSTAKLDSISSSLQGSLTEDFDGKKMSGARVLSAIKEYANSGDVSIILYNTATPAAPVARTGAYAIEKVDSPSNIGSTTKEVKLSGTAGSGITEIDWLDEWNDSNAATKKTALRDFSDPTKGDVFINTAKQYKASVVKTSAGAVVGIAFQPVVGG